MMPTKTFVWFCVTLYTLPVILHAARNHDEKIRHKSRKNIELLNIDQSSIVNIVRLPRASDDASHKANNANPDHVKPGNDGAHGNTMGHLQGQMEGHGNESDGSEHGHGEGSHGIHVASWNYAYVETPFLVVAFMLIAALVKLGFHQIPYLSSIIPESCVLIILGITVGAILRSQHSDHAFLQLFTPQLFFLILLPPIILEAAYSLHDRVFSENIGTIILYAVIGTVLNCFLIGSLLILLAYIGAMGAIKITAVECLVFSALIVAVDPVAVLAIFQEIGVNNVLYFLVFGESLFNDAVTVVLYNTMKAFMGMESIPVSQVFLGLAAFFCVSLGGLCIGIILGLLTALITRFTEEVRVVEPLALLVLAYMSYLLAEMFHFSGIISIIGCGLVQVQYAFHNVSFKSSTTVTYFTKMLSSMCDCIIFLFLGVALTREHTWHVGFILWSLFLCIAIRFAVVYCLTYLANRLNRVRIIGWQEQFIMAYGGLRGAVAFALVAMLDDKDPKDMFMTATLIIIMFTVFVQGISIKPLVRLLNIKSQDKQISLCDEVNSHVTDHIMAGIEEVIGVYGSNFAREFIDRMDDKYFKVWFQKDPQSKDDYIMELYEKIALQQHYEGLLGSPEAMERYTSVLDLYQPQMDDDERRATGLSIIPPLDPELMNMTLDMMSRRRSAAVPGIVRRADRRKGSLMPVPETGRKTSHEEMPMDVNSRKSSAADGEQPATGARRRRSTLAVVLLNKQRTIDEEGVIENPTAQHLRKWMVKNPRNQLFHRKYDKNLQNEADRDLLHHLYDKQLRTDRFMRRMGVAFARSPASSEQGIGSATHSPMGSPLFQRHLMQPKLPVIPGGSPDPRRLPPGQRLKFRRGPIVHAQTIDVPSGEEKLKVWEEDETGEHLFKRNKPSMKDLDRHQPLFRRSMPEEPPQETILESPEENLSDSSDGSPSAPAKHDLKVFPTEEATTARMPSRRSPRAPLFRGYTLAAPDLHVQDDENAEEEDEPAAAAATPSRGNRDLPPIQESRDSISTDSDSRPRGSRESQDYVTLPAITLPYTDSHPDVTKMDNPTIVPTSEPEHPKSSTRMGDEGGLAVVSSNDGVDTAFRSGELHPVDKKETPSHKELPNEAGTNVENGDTKLKLDKREPQDTKSHAPQRGPSLLHQGRQRSVGDSDNETS